MNRRKENANKGFSLVELIIVVAIMAVLVGVLAPQYMKYVERSRNSTDNSNATAIESAVQVWGAETEIPSGQTAFTAGTGTITVDNTGVVCDSTDATFEAALTSALANAGIDTTTTCVSRTAWTSYEIAVTVASDGVVSMTTTYN